MNIINERGFADVKPSLRLLKAIAELKAAIVEEAATLHELNQNPDKNIKTLNFIILVQQLLLLTLKNITEDIESTLADGIAQNNKRVRDQKLDPNYR